MAMRSIHLSTTDLEVILIIKRIEAESLLNPFSGEKELFKLQSVLSSG